MKRKMFIFVGAILLVSLVAYGGNKLENKDKSKKKYYK